MEEHNDRLEQLCKSYSEYVKVDTTCQVKAIEDAIEETLTRLEEFETILLMARSSAEGQLTTALLDKKEDLMKTCQKVCYLEEMVFRLKQQVDLTEQQVVSAEAQLRAPATPLHSFLKPLLFMRGEGSAGVGPAPRDLTYTPHPIMSVDHFFCTQPADS